MLSLPLSSTPPEKRRRIGATPQRGEDDTRALWFPPLVFEGKKIKKPAMEVFETRWPDDNSQLAACRLELYFLPDFPFPFWLETSNGHLTMKIRTVECGNASNSPITMPIPHRSPIFLDNGKREGDVLKLKLRSPAYYTHFSLFAIDLTDPMSAPIPITFESAKKGKEELSLNIPLKGLKPLLQDGHAYRWILTSEEDKHLYAESDEPLRWHL
jgi:hypothetical protein